MFLNSDGMITPEDMIYIANLKKGFIITKDFFFYLKGGIVKKS